MAALNTWKKQIMVERKQLANYVNKPKQQTFKIKIFSTETVKAFTFFCNTGHFSLSITLKKIG